MPESPGILLIPISIPLTTCGEESVSVCSDSRREMTHVVAEGENLPELTMKFLGRELSGIAVLGARTDVLDSLHLAREILSTWELEQEVSDVVGSTALSRASSIHSLREIRDGRLRDVIRCLAEKLWVESRSASDSRRVENSTR